MNQLPELQVLFHRFAIALALGLFIGVEREIEKAGTFAGIRTFPLISMLGCMAAMLNELFIPWTFAVILIIFAAFVLSAYRIVGSASSPGITTEISSLLAFLFGALVWWQMTYLAAALAVVTVLLLASKKPLEGLARKIGQQDIAAALQFAVITLIIFPILPDETYGPLNVLNPHDIWLMVILIAGINLIGYVLIKIFGPHQGIGLAGFLGGIGSSTALTLSFTRHCRKEPDLAADFAFAIVLASSIMFARVLVLAGTVNPELGMVLLVPIGSAGVVGLLGCAYLWFSQKGKAGQEGREHVKASNPFELWPAIQFGVLFGVILFVAKAAQVYFGAAGVYLSSTITGLTDVDAITLSISKLEGSSIPRAVAVQGITLAALSNTGMKALIAAIGAPALRRYVLPLFGAMIAAGLMVSFFLI
ncbi:MAG: MgtC/SapB family protein [Proteobacteria bacterium]|nr:MgtC/SapB family protein [Pseudomonadota bacterium]